MHQIIIALVGPDRPGIVDDISAMLAERGANVADARLVNLRGQFAGVLLAEVPEAEADALARDLPAQGKPLGLTITVSPVDGQGQPKAGGVPYRVRTYSMDQAGIVHRITHLLHTRGVNIEELTTRLGHGAHTGTPLFSMDMVITVPSEVPLRQLRDALESLCDDLNCDLDIDAV